MGSKSHIGYRNSENGRFVRENYAKNHSKTTERQHIPNAGRGVTDRGSNKKSGK